MLIEDVIQLFLVVGLLALRQQQANNKINSTVAQINETSLHHN